MPFVEPDWNRTLGDLEILTRCLHEIASAMLTRSTPKLFAALQHMKVYCEKFQSDMWVDERH